MEEYILDMMYEEWRDGADGADILKCVIDLINQSRYNGDPIEYDGYIIDEGWIESDEEIGVALLDRHNEETYIYVQLPEEGFFTTHP